MEGFAKTEGELCPDCKAGPSPENACVERGLPIQMWHTPDCPQWTIMQIDWEASSRRVKEQDEWAKGVFPAAAERLKQAAAAIEPGTAAQPFIDALTELVQGQASTSGFVVLHRWAEIFCVAKVDLQASLGGGVCPALDGLHPSHTVSESPQVTGSFTGRLKRFRLPSLRRGQPPRSPAAQVKDEASRCALRTSPPWSVDAVVN
jgi:hypothetical protein